MKTSSIISSILTLIITAVLLTACGSSKRGKQENHLQQPVVVIDTPSPKHDHKQTKKSSNPWVTNISRPNDIRNGLSGRHLSLWASHGRYYAAAKKRWEWQRPNLFGTNEDIFTQTFVVPYIIPMLENAGAVVYTPRERDWQTNEIVIDNDKPNVLVNTRSGAKTYLTTSKNEYNEIGKWRPTEEHGFANPYNGQLRDGNTPFIGGTARVVNTSKGNATAFVEYTPTLPEDGDYAVYVSYKTVEGSIGDAHYTVFHGGQQTEICVNQQMGGGTWVYLGTFHFTTDPNTLNGVVLDNHSSSNGKVTTDAVRFGGGMGTVMRGEGTLEASGLPRALEGSRYFCEWAGAPYSIYGQRNGTDDYADDLNCRSMMVNWLAGGSTTLPDSTGLNVPLELNLAVHSDAGFNRDFKSIYGSLGVITTDFHNGKLGDGSSRSRSRNLVDAVTESVRKDLTATYGLTWPVRGIWDKNYSETRRPEIPSIIFETLSHQSFPDMRLAHDPMFKFTLSRAVYKSLLRYLNPNATVAPLAPVNVRSMLSDKGKLTLSWDSQVDPLEPGAIPTSYILYMAKNGGDFDNGRVVKSTSITLTLTEGVTYRFRIAAANDGGRSFPSEEIAAVYHAGAPQVLVINAFHRLASPQVVNTDGRLGFDIAADPGISYGKTSAWIGYQQVFDTSKSNIEGPGGYGFSGEELIGQFVAGNDFNYVSTHIDAIASSHQFSAVSCSVDALPHYYGSLQNYVVIDAVLGNQRNDGYSLSSSPAIPELLSNTLLSFGGGILISGSYIVSDGNEDFLRQRLSVGSGGKNTEKASQIHGMGMTFDVYRTLNDKHYASTSSDILQPFGAAFPVLAYNDGTTAAVATNGKSFVMGFPFECIQSSADRRAIMSAILSFLTK